MKTWEHDELAEDLGNNKGTNLLNAHLGSPYLQKSVQRADVVEIKPSYTRFCISIYEAKISRSDFQSDIRSGKWRGYLDHCHRFYFAVPAGMVKKEEIPDEAGLIVRGKTGWKTLKPAKLRDIEIPYMTLLSLLFVKQRKDFRESKRLTVYNAKKWYDKTKLYTALGAEVGDALRNYDEYQDVKNSFEHYRKRISELIEQGLGEKHAWPEWELDKLVKRIKEKAKKE
jgi:hypothetical protein